MTAGLLKRKLVSDAVQWRVVQGMIFATGLLLLILGFYKLSELDLTEAQLLLGVGIVFTLTLQCMIMGLLVEIARRPRSSGDRTV